MDLCPGAVVDPPLLAAVTATPPSPGAVVDAPLAPRVTAVAPPSTQAAAVDGPVLPTVGVSWSGPPGPAGPAGESSSIATLTAGQTLSGHRVVATHVDGTVLYASNDTLTDATRQLWVTLGAADEGDAVQCQSFGRVNEGGWSWTDDPIFLGVDGFLTQTPPSAPDAAFFLQVAAPDGPTALVFNPRNPFQL